MPTELGDPFSITWRGAPEQMLTWDVPLWHLFLNGYGHIFQRFYYNVRVGGPIFKEGSEAPEMRKMWYDVNAKRIDAIGEKDKEIWIIEVTSGPDMRTVGQCLSYKLLWEEDPKIKKPVKMVLVCYFLDLDLERILKHYRVSIIKIETPA